MDFAARITRTPFPSDPARGAGAAALFPDAPPALSRLLEGAAGSSPYLCGLIQREAGWLRDALDAGDVVGRETAGFETLTAVELGPALRRAKRRVALWIGLADLGGVWSVEEVTAALTGFADRATDLAFRAHVEDEARRGKLPTPRDGADPDAAGLFVLAMGKMGAGELNYSSDIDLIVLYDDAAYAPADQSEVRAALIRATRKAVATLSDLTEHGYVFRTDLRLRPDASVTPVCISAAAALSYYEAEGRGWERAAYIKARVCAGDLAAGARFLGEIRPFVWRRALDFATVQDTHDMRRRIRSHKGLHGPIRAMGHDMKLGQGGIRDIEFFAQTGQLIAGGRDPDLRDRATVPALAALAAKGWIPQAVADDLTVCYRAHRRVEHRVQMINDSQTHVLPHAAAAFAQVAALDASDDPAAWAAEIEARLGRVDDLAGDFFDPGAGQPDDADLPPMSAETAAMIERWRTYPALRSGRAQEIFARIEPQILARMGRAAHPDEALARFDSFLRGLPAGVQLFSLFGSNPQLIDLLADICGTVPGLAAYLARHPEVLDAVLAGHFFAPWPGAQGLRETLSDQLGAILTQPAGGYEVALDAARRWAHEWQFRVGVHHLRGLIGADEAAVQYADIADAAIGALTGVVGRNFAARHGAPPGRGAVVLGMGSLGARHLNAQSDLDLIVIYDAGGVEASDGARPLAARAYYARLTQALLTAVSAPTASGRLYEVDMRLRPSGRQGPVATALSSFRDYQMAEAWTWEHLALTRACVIAGVGGEADAGGADKGGHGAALAAEVEALRVEILRARGGDPRVAPDLADMRARIFAAKAPDGRWEAKNGRGRLQDIELLAQSFAVRTGSPARAVAAQLRAGTRAGLIDAADALALAEAWRALWRMHCAARLLNEGRLDMDAAGLGGQEFLLREMGQPSLDALAADLEGTVEATGAIVDRLVRNACAETSVRE